MKRTAILSALLLIAAACAAPVRVAPTIPQGLEPGDDEAMIGTLAAHGVQIYECRGVNSDDGQQAVWAFVAPEAELFAEGRPVGRHYAGPHWESVDGSRVAGVVKARAEAPREGAIPWLLLATRSVGPDGALAGVTSIQRINTEGGTAPSAEGCTLASLGQRARVAYTADYVLYGAR
ncbi:MAG TPA: DUF3455 domain-containing protein [Burkholderiaceae bacterium]|nr:DUF3455 domain-containing protein [Burkholderiaceae bacterium]